MNAAETIQAAIEKLSDLRDGATPGRWAYYNEPFGDIMSEQEAGLGVETTVAGEMSDFDGTLVVVLHRTIDAQLAILRETHRLVTRSAVYLRARPELIERILRRELLLARSILGEAS